MVLGTGPSLLKQRDRIIELREQDKIRIFGINNTFADFPLDVWIACDETWHRHFGKIEGDFDKWHWSKAVCHVNKYNYIEGRWGNGPFNCSGLSTDPGWIAYGHSSGYQALGLAVHYGCDPIYLAGYDMHYNGPQRHYFTHLSDRDGEYPPQLRKWSTLDGLRVCYEQIAKQIAAGVQLPRIINLTHDSALRCFEFGDL